MTRWYTIDVFDSISIAVSTELHQKLTLGRQATIMSPFLFLAQNRMVRRCFVWVDISVRTTNANERTKILRAQFITCVSACNYLWKLNSLRTFINTTHLIHNFRFTIACVSLIHLRCRERSAKNQKNVYKISTDCGCLIINLFLFLLCVVVAVDKHSTSVFIWWYLFPIPNIFLIKTIRHTEREFF